ncbi:MAG: hypothetical protein NWR72_08680 [Bacteroidia bacterium]|nr:hypothetical protein [Bacteroidia bacterium]
MSFQTITFTQKVPVGPFLKLGFFRYLRRPIFLMVAGIWVFSSAFGSNSGADTLSWTPVYWLIAAVVIFPGLHLLGLKALLSTNLMLRSEQEVRANESGINFEGPDFQSFLAWKAFTNLKITSEWVLLFTSRNSIVYIYLPMIADEGDRAIFQAMCRNQLENQSVGRS